VVLLREREAADAAREQAVHASVLAGVVREHRLHPLHPLQPIRVSRLVSGLEAWLYRF